MYQFSLQYLFILDDAYVLLNYLSVFWRLMCSQRNSIKSINQQYQNGGEKPITVTVVCEYFAKTPSGDDQMTTESRRRVF